MKNLILSSVLLLILPSLGLAQTPAKPITPVKVPTPGVQAPAPITATSDHKIPFFLDIGFGLGEYEIYDVYNSNPADPDFKTSSKIYGTQLVVRATVEKETIQRFMDKIPPEARDFANKTESFSVGTFWIPKTLYINPRKDHVQAFGATWGLILGTGLDMKFLKLNIAGGPIITYINFDDDRDTKKINFIRPGLRGTVSAQVPLFTKYVQFEVGGLGDIYVPQKFYADKSAWNIKAYFANIHFFIPIELDNPFKDKK